VHVKRRLAAHTTILWGGPSTACSPNTPARHPFIQLRQLARTTSTALACCNCRCPLSQYAGRPRGPARRLPHTAPVGCAHERTRARHNVGLHSLYIHKRTARLQASQLQGPGRRTSPRTVPAHTRVQLPTGSRNTPGGGSTNLEHQVQVHAPLCLHAAVGIHQSQP
jgi:hypothetical protein